MKKYFARANTSQGLVNLTMNNLKNISNLYIIEGKSKTAKSRLMEYVVKYLSDKYQDIECIYSPFNIRQLDAVIIREIKFAMADRDCVGAEALGKTVNTDEFLHSKRLEVSSEYLNELKEKSSEAIGGLYDAYKKAKSIHDDWEKIYIENMDFDSLNSYTKGIIDELTGSRKGKNGTDRYERFFGASTPDGSVNYIDNITEKMEKRYFIKGRPGTGKSTFLKKLANEVQKAGFDTEVYYCSFDKNSLDMTLVPELGFCVFDSTSPHEMFPKDKRDVVLDFYKESGLCGTDERFEKQLSFIAAKYKHKISEGVAKLRLGCLYMSEYEFYLDRITDFDEISRTADKIIRSLEK